MHFDQLVDHPSLTPITVSDLVEIVTLGHQEAPADERQHRQRDHVVGLRVRRRGQGPKDPSLPLVVVGLHLDGGYLVGQPAYLERQVSAVFRTLGSELLVDLRSLEARSRLLTALGWCLYETYEVHAIGITWHRARHMDSADCFTARAVLQDVAHGDGLDAAVKLTALANWCLGRCEISDVATVEGPIVIEGEEAHSCPNL